MNDLISFQNEILKRLNSLISQMMPFLPQEHQAQVAAALERAKQVSIPEPMSVSRENLTFFRGAIFPSIERNR